MPTLEQLDRLTAYSICREKGYKYRSYVKNANGLWYWGESSYSNAMLADLDIEVVFVQPKPIAIGNKFFYQEELPIGAVLISDSGTIVVINEQKQWNKLQGTLVVGMEYTLVWLPTMQT